MEDNLEAWCNKLLEMKFEVKHSFADWTKGIANRMQDPAVRKRTLQLLVYFSTTALHSRNGFMLKVLEHILVTWPTLEPAYRAFNEATKDLQGESMVELQRLASEMPDHLLVTIS